MRLILLMMLYLLNVSVALQGWLDTPLKVCLSAIGFLFVGVCLLLTDLVTVTREEFVLYAINPGTFPTTTDFDWKENITSWKSWITLLIGTLLFPLPWLILMVNLSAWYRESPKWIHHTIRIISPPQLKAVFFHDTYTLFKVRDLWVILVGERYVLVEPRDGDGFESLTKELKSAVTMLERMSSGVLNHCQRKFYPL